MASKSLAWLKNKLSGNNGSDREEPQSFNTVLNIMVCPVTSGNIVPPKLARACPDTQCDYDIMSFGFVKDVLRSDAAIEPIGKEIRLESLDRQPISFRGSIEVQWYKAQNTRSHSTRFLVSTHQDPSYDVLFSCASSETYDLLIPQPVRGWASRGWIPGSSRQNASSTNTAPAIRFSKLTSMPGASQSQDTELERAMRENAEIFRQHQQNLGRTNTGEASGQTQTNISNNRPHQGSTNATSQESSTTQNPING